MFLIGILLLLLGIGIYFYYYYLFKRMCSNKEIKKVNRVIILILCFMMTILSLNLFSVIGLFLMHFIIISLIIDIIVFSLKKLNLKMNFFNKIHCKSIIPLFLTFLLFIYGFLNIRIINEKKYTIYTEKKIGEDIRTLFISDMHYGSIFNKEMLVDLKTRLDNVNADIVVLGGDIVDEETSKKEMEEVFEVLGNINNNMGIYFVYGNHDEQQYDKNKKYNLEELNDILEKNNIKILMDNYLKVKDNVILVGRNDYSVERKKLNDFLNKTSQDYLIVIDHQPVEYNENINMGVDLIVSGHTHAGQIFPVKFLIDLFKTADLSYGYKRIDGMDAIVSSGISGWKYPIRTSSHSEYVIIDIKEI